MYDKEIDVWALGVICFELNAGFTPFSKRTEKETFEAICKVNFCNIFYLFFFFFFLDLSALSLELF